MTAVQVIDYPARSYEVLVTEGRAEATGGDNYPLNLGPFESEAEAVEALRMSEALQARRVPDSGREAPQ